MYTYACVCTMRTSDANKRDRECVNRNQIIYTYNEIQQQIQHGYACIYAYLKKRKEDKKNQTNLQIHIETLVFRKHEKKRIKKVNSTQMSHKNAPTN